MDQPKRGRPPAEQPGATVCTWLPAPQHDQLIRLANQRGESVSAVVRQAVTRILVDSR